jgi:hypothetical protein
MVTRRTNTKGQRIDMMEKFKVLLKFWKLKFRRDILKKEHLTYNQFLKKYGSKSKNDIIKEIVFEASKIIKGEPVIDAAYKKVLRSYPKKHLIKSLLELKLKKQFGG